MCRYCLVYFDFDSHVELHVICFVFMFLDFLVFLHVSCFLVFISWRHLWFHPTLGSIRARQAIKDKVKAHVKSLGSALRHSDIELVTVEFKPGEGVVGRRPESFVHPKVVLVHSILETRRLMVGNLGVVEKNSEVIDVLSVGRGPLKQCDTPDSVLKQESRHTGQLRPMSS